MYEVYDLGNIGPSVSDFDDVESKETWELRCLLKTWLECLQESGVDLEEYGRKEADLDEQGLVSWSWHQYPDTKVFLTSLTYGPSLGDWKVRMEYRVEEMTGMPVKTPVKMPGGWIEDDDDDSEGESDLWGREGGEAGEAGKGEGEGEGEGEEEREEEEKREGEEGEGRED